MIMPLWPYLRVFPQYTLGAIFYLINEIFMLTEVVFLKVEDFVALIYYSDFEVFMLPGRISIFFSLKFKI